MPTWPDLDASLDYDAGWRQRFFEVDNRGRCRPVARPVFHRVADAVFGPDGALARLAAGTAVAVYVQAGGIGLVLGRADRTPVAGGPDGPAAPAAIGSGAGDGPGTVVAAVLAPDSPPPLTAPEVWDALASPARRRLGADPGSWPTSTTCC